MTTTKEALQRKAASAPQKQQSIQQLIKVMEPQIAKALPSVITPERFTRMVFSALSSNPKLQQCDAKTFLGAMMQAAQLGLEPNTPLGQAYLIPYKKVCQFQIGYKGLIDLAYRSGEFASISAQTVYENDEFNYELGLHADLTHKPAMSNRGEPIAYYAVFKLISGGFGFEVMSREDAEKHGRKFSKSYNDSPWQTNFDEMAKKTVLKKALKYAPLKTEFARGVVSDETVKTDITEDMTEIPDKANDFIDIETPAGVDPETGEKLAIEEA